MTTNANVIYEELSTKMKRALDEAVSRRSHTVSFEGSYKLDAEAQSVFGVGGSPFAGAVYDPGMGLGDSPACYVLSDDLVDLLAN